MASAVQLIILFLSVGIALGGSLQWDITDNQNIEEMSDDIDLNQLMSGLLGLSEDDYKMLLEEVWQVVVRHQHGSLCEEDTCKLCLKHLPLIGRICFELEYVKSPAGIHLMLTRGGKELICITFPNETPKICLFHHICAQVVDININKGEICASFEFNGVTVIRDHCINV